MHSSSTIASTKAVIKKIRKENRKFQKSPLLSDQLEQFVNGTSSGVKLVLDNKTRWNSILRMLRNFLKLEPALKAYYGNYSREKGDFPLSQSEIGLTKEIVTTLGHVELCTMRLSKDDATMYKADLALQVRHSFGEVFCSRLPTM